MLPKRRNTWHRPDPSNQLAERTPNEVGRKGEAAGRSSLTWQRVNSQPSGGSKPVPKEALSFEQQFQWLQKQPPVPRQPAAPFQPLHKSWPPSRLSIPGGHAATASARFPREDARQAGRHVSRHWVRPTEHAGPPSYVSQGNRLSQSTAGQSPISKPASSVAPAAPASQIPEGLSVTSVVQQRSHTGLEAAHRASSDSSTVSSSSRLASPSLSSTNNAALAAAGTGLLPRTSLQYTNCLNGLTLRRVSIATKKGQRQQLHLAQHTYHRPAASLAHADSAAAGRVQPQSHQASPSLLGARSTASAALCVTPAGQQLVRAATLTGTASEQVANRTSSKHKLPMASASVKRARSSSSHLQTPSRSKKLQRLGDDFYSSSGKGGLRRKGSKIVSQIKKRSSLSVENAQAAQKVLHLHLHCKITSLARACLQPT